MSTQDIQSDCTIGEYQTIESSPYNKPEFRWELAEFIKLIGDIRSEYEQSEDTSEVDSSAGSR